MDKPRLPITTPDAVPPRRLASIRRLMLTGIGLLALVAIGEFFILGRHAELALLRGEFIAIMFGLWSLSRRADKSIVLAALVCLQLLLAAVGTSLGLYFDHAQLASPLDAMMLIIVVSGPAWPNLRYFAVGMLACLVPLVVALVATAVSVAIWYHYAVYLGASVLSAFVLWRQRMSAADASARLRGELQRLAVEDALTGILNRTGWNQQAPAVLAAAAANDQPASLLYLDLDHFKSINDRHGHAVGDAVIEHAARLIRTEVRQHDLVARLGGEEFAVLLIDTGAIRACAVAERIRCDFESDRSPVRSSLCVGVAERRHGEGLAGLMARADAALLRAKRDGRNRVEQADEPAAETA